MPQAISSCLLSATLAGRNVDGRETQWPTTFDAQLSKTSSKQLCIRVMATIPILLNTVIALIETVVYSIFTIFLWPVSLCSERGKKSYQWLKEQLGSAFCTIFWSAMSLVENFKKANLLTSEASLRFYFHNKEKIKEMEREAKERARLAADPKQKKAEETAARTTSRWKACREKMKNAVAAIRYAIKKVFKEIALFFSDITEGLFKAIIKKVAPLRIDDLKKLFKAYGNELNKNYKDSRAESIKTYCKEIEGLQGICSSSTNNIPLHHHSHLTKSLWECFFTNDLMKELPFIKNLIAEAQTLGVLVTEAMLTDYSKVYHENGEFHYKYDVNNKIVTVSTGSPQQATLNALGSINQNDKDDDYTKYPKPAEKFARYLLHVTKREQDKGIDSPLFVALELYKEA